MGDGGVARETAGVTTRLIVRYVRGTGGPMAVDEVLRAAGERRRAEVLEDERTWSTYAQKVALFDAAACVLDDPHVALRIGESVLAQRVGSAVRAVLWMLGSPSQVLRNIAKTGHKFSTVADYECLDAGRTRAVIAYRLHDGYEPSRHDCEYTLGLLSQATAMFGLPAATVDHDSCQVRGNDRCVYALSWPRRSRFLPSRGRKRRLETELGLMAEHVAALQSAAADLVAADDLQTTLDRIPVNARSAVEASGAVLVAHPLAGGAPTIHGDADVLDAVDGSRIVVEVASPRRVYGELTVAHPGGHGFFDEEERVLVAFGALAAAALDAAAARETTSVLLELARSLAELTSSDAVCQRVAEAMPSVVGAPMAAVARWSAGRHELVFRGVHGFDPDSEHALRNLTVRPSDTPELADALQVADPRYYDKRADDPFARSSMDVFGVDAVVVVPMLMRGEPVGFVLAGWPSPPAGGPGAELIARMEGIASQAATALENARVLEQTTHQALHDPLTGLPNRILLHDRVRQAAARARREGSAIGVLLVDLDGFKAVNDTLGHRAGDDVLREVAWRLVTQLRDADTAARLGGDEFVLVLSGVSSEEEVADVIRRVEAAVAAPISVGEVQIALGASIGFAVVDGSVADVDALLARADAAMYGVKRGRPDRAPMLLRAAS